MEQQIILTDLDIMTLDRRKQWARWISNLFSPPIFGLAGLFLVAQTQHSVADWLWILVYIGVAILIPVLYVVWLLKKKQITDFHIKLRHQRFKPMLVMVLCSILARIILQLGSAPIILQTIAIMGAVLMAIILGITLRWEISGHATAVSAFALFCISFWGLAALPVLILIPAVIWARLALQRHSLAQTIAGTLLGGVFVLCVHVGIAMQCSGVLLSCG
jgi:membrane-associated phospholipid phosphatase